MPVLQANNPSKKRFFSVNDLDTSLTYSYEDYETWVYDGRVALINGKVFQLTPPSRHYQQLSDRISSLLFNYLKDYLCKVCTAPFDVRISKPGSSDKDICTVLQPDICVICDPAKMDKWGCVGAPDIVVEIQLPEDNRTELLYHVYEEFGVKEYWVINPSEKTFRKHILDQSGKYQSSRLFTLNEKIEVLPDFILDIGEIFGS